MPVPNLINSRTAEELGKNIMSHIMYPLKS